jgi:thioesterase domain-containing protein
MSTKIDTASGRQGTIDWVSADYFIATKLPNKEDGGGDALTEQLVRNRKARPARHNTIRNWRMLTPVQTSGMKPPLFFVHGLIGVMTLSSSLARALGPDQPFYAIHANGIDGRQPVLDDMQEIVSAYTEQIRAARPAGPIRIGGMCTGCIIAIEICRAMQQEHRKTGPVILVDPPPLPTGYKWRLSKLDAGNPKIAEQWYQQTRDRILDHLANPDNNAPFDPKNTEQLHFATLAGAGLLIAFLRYVPSPFAGSTEVITSAPAAPGFFHPQMPWQKLLSGPRVVHVLPWDHRGIYRGGCNAMCRLIRFILQEPSTIEGFTDRPAEFSSGVLGTITPDHVDAGGAT